ncbi:prepilin peptidase [Nesterenkonia lutea]|uniref:Leader peptidase (Prepilin peptidase)/N-methyltransferase n=1 Tax=Nesterenkonia lutea TaxID=272919 RepID=A0ABR9JBL7_9MICC|nr:A24 family peptidase [Nesterenkonia lutea]MBE1523328.1 leader peptidase (prepilin peptidase)/N-methyltransferase [Nesterenkonia lutea]
MIAFIVELLASGSLARVMAGLLLLLGGVVFAVCALALSFSDLREHRLPNRIIYPWAGVAVGLLIPAALLLGQPLVALRALAAALIWGTAFLVVRMISPRALGMGDVKLAVVLGLYAGLLGWATVLVAVVLSFLLGGLVSAALLISGRATAKTTVPFGPFLLLGTALALTLSGGISLG